MNSHLRFWIATTSFGFSAAIIVLLFTVSQIAGLAGIILALAVALGLRFALPKATPNVKSADAESGSPATSMSPQAVFEATMNSMREGIIVVDQAMRVVASNKAAEQIFDARAGLAGRLSEITRDPAVFSAFRTGVTEGRTTNVKIEGIGPEKRSFDLRVAPLLSEESGQARGAIGTFVDITRIERLERMRQEFLSNVSHELRTPLTSILAFVETLEDGAIDDSLNNRRFLSVIKKSARRMHTLIDDILELSGIENGQVPVTPQELLLRPVAQDVLNSFAAQAGSRKVTLVNDVPSDAVIFAEARRLEQMLANLVDNAIKFNKEGGSVTLEFERGLTDKIVVSDTGDGISNEHVERIFERFYRVDRARSREMEGTGLGLAIVKHLARAHGGEAIVQSEPGAGSRFTIELPAAPKVSLREATNIESEKSETLKLSLKATSTSR